MVHEVAGPRDIKRVSGGGVGTQVSKTQVRLDNKAGTRFFLLPESEMKSQFFRLENVNG